MEISMSLVPKFGQRSYETGGDMQRSYIRVSPQRGKHFGNRVGLCLVKAFERLHRQQRSAIKARALHSADGEVLALVRKVMTFGMTSGLLGRSGVVT
jgi:hypothetical protein